jgi:poly(3-hydroxybutyrate) depolymerase
MCATAASTTNRDHPSTIRRPRRGLWGRPAGTLLRFAAAAAALSVTAIDAMAEPLRPGPSQETAALPSASLNVFTYRPGHCQPSSLLLVFHGLHRNASGYRDDARAVADAACMLVLAPLFEQDRFPAWRYQFGGIVVERRQMQDPRQWTGNLVLELVEWARQKEGRRLSYSMIGHSAGAQFLSRVAAYMPTEAQRIVLANPSTYVAPTVRVAAPFGLGGLYADGDAERALRRYLAQPVTIYLGGEDTGDQDLSQSKSAMAQGATRLERGLNIYQQGRVLAASQHWTFNWRLVELPGVGHSARKMFAAQQTLVALKP